MRSPRSLGPARRESTEGARRRRALRPWDVDRLEPRRLLATIRWTGFQDQFWSNAGNWDLNRAPRAGDDLVFPGNARNTIMVDDIDNLSINSITFGESYTLNGTDSGGGVKTKLIINRTNAAKPGIKIDSAAATVDFRPDVLDLQKATPIEVPSGSTLNFLGTPGVTSRPALTGPGAFTKSGGGQFVFATQGASAYTGKPTVTGGPITIGVSTSLPSKLTLAAGASLSLRGVGGSSVTFDLPGGLDGGDGTIGLGGDGSRLTINGDVTGGRYFVGEDATLQLGTVTGGTFTIAPTSNPISVGKVVSGTFTLTSERGDFFNPPRATTLTVNDPGGGTFGLDSGSTLVVDTQGVDRTFTSSLAQSSSGTVIKKGAGTLTLAGRLNGLSGGFAVREGTLRLGVDGALPHFTGFYLDAGATLELNGHDLTVPTLLGSDTLTSLDRQRAGGTIALNDANLTVDTGSLDYAFGGYFGGTISGNGGLIKKGPGTLYLGGGAYNYAGTTRVDAGTLTLGEYAQAQPARITLPGRVQVTFPGTLGSLATAGASIGSLAGDGTASIGNGLTVGSDNSSTTFTGGFATLSGVAGLTKVGAGGLTLLSGFANPLLRARAVVAGGVLRFDAPAISGGESAIQVNSGGTLQGTGGPGAIDVAPGGTVRPGDDAPGTLRSSGDLTFAANSTLAVRINSTNPTGGYDRLVNPSGKVTVAGARLVPTLGYLPRVGDSFAIISASGVVGRFAGLPDGGTLAVDGIPFTILYAADGVTLRRDQAVTATTLRATPGPAGLGRPVTLTATVTPAATGPTGVVTFFDGPTRLGAATLDGSGVARLTTSSLAAGTHSLTAFYAGDAGNLSNFSAALALVVRPVVPTLGIAGLDDTGIKGDGVTASRRPRFVGTSDPGSTVRLHVVGNGQLSIPYASTVAGPDGSYSLQFPDPLQNGGARVATQATDPLGNKGPVSPGLDVRVVTVAGDYLGTGAAQYAVFRPTSETYIVRGLGALQIDVTPGRDIPAQYDFAGDGKVDQVAYRFDAAQYFGFRSDYSVLDRQFGTPGLSLPVSGTYDGPGRLIYGLYNPNTGTWAIDLPTPGGRVVDFGRPYQDIPAPAAYEGGGQARIAFFRPGDAGGVDGDSFYVLAPDSLNNYRVSFTEPAVVAQGFVYRPGDIPAPADYDGVGRDQFAVYRPSTGQFFILRVPNIFNAGTWTLRTVTLNLPGGPRPGDVPASQDYDGTGRASPTAFRPSSSTFHSIRTTDGAQRDIQFGQPGLDVAAAGPLLYRLSALSGPFASSGGYPAEVTTTGGGTYIPRGAGGTTRAASPAAPPATTGGSPTALIVVTTGAPGPAAPPAVRVASPAARAATTAGARTPRVRVATPAPTVLEVLTFGHRHPTAP